MDSMPELHEHDSGLDTDNADPNGAIFLHCKQAVLKEGLDQLYVCSSKGSCKHTLSIKTHPMNILLTHYRVLRVPSE